LIFEHGETIKTIDIEVIDDHQFEKDETFMIEFVDLKTQGAKFGRLKKTVVTIVSDDGMLKFLFPHYKCIDIMRYL